MNYSNAGVGVAGHVAERATGKSWEALMHELLFEPLGMTSAGFGAPGAADELDQPRGHGADGEAIEPGPEADNPPLLGPAGTCHMSLNDWARFLALHLRGAKGDVKVGEITLRRATMERLRTAYPGGDTPYGYGWLLPKRDWAGGDKSVLTHSGSNTMWYCTCWLDPASGLAYLAATNCATPKAPGAVDAAVQLMQREQQRRARESRKSNESP
jgi:CubicO group peptidase (beta-lactamase class C family)